MLSGYSMAPLSIHEATTSVDYLLPQSKALPHLTPLLCKHSYWRSQKLLYFVLLYIMNSGSGPYLVKKKSN